MLPYAVEYNLYPKRLMLDTIPLTGKIDIIESLDDNSLVLIDSKTGSVKSGREMMRAGEEGRYGRQLLFYAVMIRLDPALRDRPLAGLGIEFVEGRDGAYRRVMIEYTEDDIMGMQTIIREAWAQISDITYWREALAQERKDDNTNT